MGSCFINSVFSPPAGLESLYYYQDSVVKVYLSVVCVTKAVESINFNVLG